MNCNDCGGQLRQEVYVDEVRDKRMIYECVDCGEEFEKCDSCSDPVVDGKSGVFEDKYGSGGKDRRHPDSGTVSVSVCSSCSLYEGLVGKVGVGSVSDVRDRYDRKEY